MKHEINVREIFSSESKTSLKSVFYLKSHEISHKKNQNQKKENLSIAEILG